MSILSKVIKYRIWLGIIFLALAIFVHIYSSSFWTAFILYFIALVGIIGHFIIGPMRLVQETISSGDIEGTKKFLSSIWFPQLLLKPIQSTYYAAKSQIAMAEKDFDSAETMMKKSISKGSDSSLMKQAEGPQQLQLGMLTLQKGDMKAGETHIRAAIRAGLQDKESLAAAYLQMSNIMMNKRQIKSAKDFFTKAKACNAKTPEIVDQLKQMNKYLSRM